MGTPLRVLIVEDSDDDCALLVRVLGRDGYDLAYQRVDTAAAMRAALDGQAWDLVISDYVMPSFGALAALAVLDERGLDLPFIIVSGKIGEDTAVAAVKAGAYDYVMKDNLSRLQTAIERALREANERIERKRAEAALRESEARNRLIIETANDAFVAIDGSGAIIDWNRKATLTFGWTRAEALGRSLWDTIIPARYREPEHGRLARLFATSESPTLNQPVELTALRRDGHEFPVELTVWPIRVGSGYC